jgi:hypothetical protein
VTPAGSKKQPGAQRRSATLWLTVEQNKQKLPAGAAAAEAVRVRRLREDARRPMSVNLAEGIALSHKLMRFTGAARKA